MVAKAVNTPFDAGFAPALTLDAQRRGGYAVVVDVAGGDAIARRLVDLGFRSGTEVRVERVAPFGDPLEVRLHGYRLALRKSEAARVIIAPRP